MKETVASNRLYSRPMRATQLPAHRVTSPEMTSLVTNPVIGLSYWEITSRLDLGHKMSELVRFSSETQHVALTTVDPSFSLEITAFDTRSRDQWRQSHSCSDAPLAIFMLFSYIWLRRFLLISRLEVHKLGPLLSWNM